MQSYLVAHTMANDHSITVYEQWVIAYGNDRLECDVLAVHDLVRVLVVRMRLFCSLSRLLHSFIISIVLFRSRLFYLSAIFCVLMTSNLVSIVKSIYTVIEWTRIRLHHIRFIRNRLCRCLQQFSLWSDTSSIQQRRANSDWTLNMKNGSRFIGSYVLNDFTLTPTPHWNRYFYEKSPIS